MNSEELKQLKSGMEQRLPEILSILGEVIKESGVAGNLNAEIKLETAELQPGDNSETLDVEALPAENNSSNVSVAIENQKVVLRGGCGWCKPCPDPIVAPDGCWIYF